MTFIGKILVLLNLVMSLIFMAFAMLVYSTRVELNTKLTKSQNDLAQLRATNSGLEQEKSTLTQQLTDQKEQAAKADADKAREIVDLKKRIDSVVRDLNDSRKEATTSLSEMKNSTTEQGTRRDEVAKLRQTREELVKKSNDLTAANSKLQDQLIETKNELKLTTTRNEQLLNRVKELEGYVVRFKGSVPDEAELRTGQDVPPPPNVEGIVTKVDGSGKFVQISLGEDDGIHKGQVLEVYRLKPEQKYLGQVRIDLTDATTAVAKPVKMFGLIQENDRVSPRILMRGN